MDVTLYDISKGVVDTWALLSSAVTNVVPASRVYLLRQPEGSTLPFCVFEFKDVSAYFGGTEYFSGPEYGKATPITVKVYHAANVDMRAFVTALNDGLGWSVATPAAAWVIPNATILMAMPEVESVDIEEDRVDGQDVLRYETTFTVKMQADRG